MADVTLTYKGSTILSLEDSATKTIKTGGKFCEGDIGLNYVSPKINRNLLDNWYFVGGGSQLGDGVFPINQRGQTVYSGAGYYGIDRWKIHTTHSIELLAIGLRITIGSNANINLVTNESIDSVLPNTVYTFSVLVVENNLASSLLFRNGSRTFGDGAPAGAIGVFSTTFIPIANTFGFQIDRTINAGKNITIAAAKLELGSEQTLAHNEGTEENPVWVLNEVPDYGEELRKCQRYYQLFRTESLRPTYGEDCRPTMATEQPTKGTLTKGGVTYYTLSSEP